MTIKSFTYIVYNLRLIGAISKHHISGAYISFYDIRKLEEMIFKNANLEQNHSLN
jgi:hypothetical protein